MPLSNFFFNYHIQKYTVIHVAASRGCRQAGMPMRQQTASAGPRARSPGTTLPGEVPVLPFTSPGEGRDVLFRVRWQAKGSPYRFLHPKHPGRRQGDALHIVSLASRLPFKGRREGGEKEERLPDGAVRRRVSLPKCRASPPEYGCTWHGRAGEGQRRRVVSSGRVSHLCRRQDNLTTTADAGMDRRRGAAWKAFLWQSYFNSSAYKVSSCLVCWSFASEAVSISW